MQKEVQFKTEISYIKNEKYRKEAAKLINMLPDYFFEVGASSTGKYHPEYAAGLGGLLRHTKAAVRMAHELLLNNSIGNVFNDDEKDLIIISLILHDGFKHGLIKEEYVRFDHPLVVSQFIKSKNEELDFTEGEINLLCSMIETHMGEWTKDYSGNEVLEKPHNKYQKFVHMCDYLASRKFIKIEFKDNEIVDWLLVIKLDIMEVLIGRFLWVN